MFEPETKILRMLPSVVNISVEVVGPSVVVVGSGEVVVLPEFSIRASYNSLE